MTDLSPVSQNKPEGNTKTSGSKNQYYRWFFTCPKEKYEASQLSQHLKDFCKEFYFQGEKGENGYEHWQGCFSLKIKEYFSTVKNHFCNEFHLEHSKDWFKCIKYCNKTETRIEGPFNHESIFIDIITELYPWQQMIVNIIKNTPDKRTIHWFWEPKGCAGKTELCKYLHVKFNSNIVQNAGTGDIAYSIKNNPKSVIFSLPRSCEERVNYEAIESIKDGIIFSKKYESCCKIFNNPHVIIFANFPPDKHKLSIDRWNIIRIDNI